MRTFQNKKFVGKDGVNNLGTRYRAVMNKHPFLTFGLPFIAVIIAGSFALTQATAVRYERNDRKVRQMTKDEELGLRSSTGRKVDMKEEYYKLAAKDLDSWEQRRVKRLPGETDGILE